MTNCTCSQVAHFMEPTPEDEHIYTQDFEVNPDGRGHYPQCGRCGIEKGHYVPTSHLYTYHCRICKQWWMERHDQKHLPTCPYAEAA